MAVYDSDSGKLVVRVVYDGPGLAGKTTNLQQMCTLFSEQRRSELYTGETAAERTLFLEWLQLDGGLVGGRELRCHLVSVPGQAVLDRRRQLLLAAADATVFVTDSTEAGLQAALPSWRSMLTRTGGPEAGIPTVLQANKQDAAGALSPDEIRERWQVDSSIPIVEAEAATGVGVRETVVLAVRAAAIRLQERLLHETLESLEGHYETGEEIERRMLEIERAHPMSPADIVIAARKRNAQPSNEATRAARSQDQSDADPPPLPKRDLPTGSFWPTVAGRITLRRLPTDDTSVLRREDANENYDADDLVFEAGIWCLKTRRDRCFSSLEAARAALLNLVHLKLALGTLLAPRTVLAIQQDSRGYWLWTIAPWLCTLRARLDHIRDRGDTERLAQELAGYSRLVQHAQHLRHTKQVTLDLDTGWLGHVCGELFYLKDGGAPEANAIADAGQALLRQVDLYSDQPRAVEHYVQITIAWLAEYLLSNEAERLPLVEALQAAQPGTDAGSRAQQQILSTITSDIAKAQ